MFNFFLSHSSKNKELAKLIYYTSLANGLRPWYDEEFLKLGDHLEQTFEKAIWESESYLLLASKDSLESEFVRFEIKTAVKRWEKDKSFKLLVVRLDDHPVSGVPKQIKYEKWDKDDVPGSVLKVISSLTGHNPFTSIAAPAFLTIAPYMIFSNESLTQEEHTRNYVFYYLAHVKQLLQAISNTNDKDSPSDTAAKLNSLSLFEKLPVLQWGIIPLGDGKFEIIHANRMRIPPRVTFNAFTGQYRFEVIRGDEISARFAIFDSRTGERVLHPTPMGLEIELEAEL